MLRCVTTRYNVSQLVTVCYNVLLASPTLGSARAAWSASSSAAPPPPAAWTPCRTPGANVRTGTPEDGSLRPCAVSERRHAGLLGKDSAYASSRQLSPLIGR
eukprot:6202077-Pyramimonas_sp.AAC.1